MNTCALPLASRRNSNTLRVNGDGTYFRFLVPMFPYSLGPCSLGPCFPIQ
jgi:hypothetical protein